MTVLSRKTVRDEISAALQSAVAGAGKVFASVYGYQIGVLNGESPVCLVLSGPIKRDLQGMGTQRYYNTIEIELHILVYDGKDNPLTEQKREDKMDECEAALATWFAAHQSGTSYQACSYTPEPTQITTVEYLDGNPYRLEMVKVKLEARDQ